MGCISSKSLNAKSKKDENKFHDVMSNDNEPKVSGTQPASPGSDAKVDAAMRQKRIMQQRGNIFAESINVDPTFEIPNIPKSEQSKKVIEEALKKNFLFAAHAHHHEQMINAMTSKIHAKGDVIIKEGDTGDFFYILEQGECTVTVDGGHEAGIIQQGDSFGELALLYNCPRAATVTLTSATSQMWALDRMTFRKIIAHSKSDQNKVCKDVLCNLELLKGLTDAQFEQLCDAVEIMTFSAGERLITLGEPGEVLFILTKGTVVCTTQEIPSKNDLRLHEGSYFGERALLTNEPRAANVFAETDVTVLVLDRQAFDELLGPLHDILDRNMGLQVLSSVPILSSLTPSDKEKLLDNLEIVAVPEGEKIITKGEEGTKFYIVKKGTVKVTRSSSDASANEVAKLTNGHYFGEMALLHSQPRQADVVAETPVELFVLEKSRFIELLGPLQDIMNREMEIRQMELEKTEEVPALADLELLANLGSGTFGVVKLARNKKSGKTYALKILQKGQIVQYRQKSSVMNEKRMIALCDHPFILKLYGTYKDATRLYLLLELVQGGELFTYLHASNRPSDAIPNKDARFYASCVLLALEYLHSKDIVYRDLKPENILIDTTGYLKIVDFGFAKIVKNRTYTLCGTPEYLAPELVLGKGHAKGVDFWALGILIYEMVSGYSPFAATSSDQMAICRNIVSAPLSFPAYIDPACRDLISKLLERDVVKRYGCTCRGVQTVKEHPFFHGVAWEKLPSRAEAPPWIPIVKSSTDTSNFTTMVEEQVPCPYKDDGTRWDADF